MFSKVLTCCSRRAGRVFVHWSNRFCVTPIAPTLFPPWEHDFDTLVLELSLLKMHRAFGAAIAMVRRTREFIATKSILNTNCVLTFLVCSALSAT